MIGGFRQSMTWLHTWSGLVMCWVLYFMFVTGTLGYFDTEIDLWMTPELPYQLDEQPFEQTLANITMAQQRLMELAPDAQRWFISPEPWRESPRLKVGWVPLPAEDGTRGTFSEAILDPTTGQVLTARETGGGQLLYRMHYLLHYLPGRSGYWIATIATMLMFIGLVTGIVAHKKIFADFFTFRWGRGQRSWLDAHNMLSVATLPFQLMITYSGLLFTLGLFWMPFVVLGGYGFDVQRVAGLQAELAGREPILRADEPGRLLPLAELARQGTQDWSDKTVSLVFVENPGDANATVSIQAPGVGRDRPTVQYMGVSGELVSEGGLELPNASARFALASIDLHEGIFAGAFLRWLYFLAGVMGTGMIATGAIYWVEARRKKDPDAQYSRGHRFVRNMNVGTFVGLLIAIGAYFWSNRLLSVDMPGREQWEVHSMFLVWLGCFVHASLRPYARAWIEQLYVLAAVFLMLPLVNALTTELHLLNTLASGSWVLAGFDLVALLVGMIALTVARHLRQRELRQKSAAIPEPSAEKRAAETPLEHSSDLPPLPRAQVPQVQVSQV
ncbi:MAG: PepSY-associated TM helix domain-containing protein [Pseudomonadota bacterium]